MSTVKGIGSFGSTALLVSSMTGPGLSTIPITFQQSGWVAPVFIFCIVALLSGCSALFVCEALSNIRGNEKFQAKVELTTIAQVYLGRKYHYVFQLLLFLALQSVNVASIIIAAQTFDSMLITLFKGTCGLGISPGGWFCVSASDGLTGNSPFPDSDYYIFTFGFALAAAIVIPLGFFSLVENIFVQMISFIVLTAILIQWVVAFGQEGLDTSLLPASGPNATMVLGIVIFNYSYITTIPSWVNSLKPGVNIHKCMWVSVFISTIFYLVLGICGAMAYKMDPSSEILTVLSTQGSVASKVTAYIFPVCALITSIPVFAIVIRSNLLRGEICSPAWATFWSNLFPWFICIPLQTKSYVGVIQNWSSLFFQSTVNYILPFILYFVSRKYVASVEPIEDLNDQATQLEDHLPQINEKSPSINQQHHSPTFPHSPVLMNPDNNDVRMFNPDDNYSISIRRSSIRPSYHSQMEQSIISQYSPNMNVYRNDPKQKIPPTIVYNSEIAGIENGFTEQQLPNKSNLDSSIYPNSLNVPSSPRFTATVGQQQQQPLQRSPNLAIGSNNGTMGGLGISGPATTANTTTPLNDQQQQQHNNNSKFCHTNSLAPPNKHSSVAPGSPEISQAAAPVNVKASPRMTSAITPANNNNVSSMLASVFSFKSSVVSPIVVPPEGTNTASVMADMSKTEGELIMTPEELQHEKDRFIAFHPKRWLNPFYLAIVCCSALSISILFMIIYDLTLAGMGYNVFD
ncbi:transmembrane amino acid transporter protein-domain-containing protein [Mycotypha africana]|uniref:transmembrane amino acid transporter protein-domain-containing protein n=1 Tax=Mycotypha africana TaxID=64632 RepID=UPI0023000614|nr:transmembrane amino acid transporter protein-domain-containing protein [Mycotypha africana]KAI8984130.1 transmembrane amino acid transporter protein-domain-containing protein [Mycotypha africana]